MATTRLKKSSRGYNYTYTDLATIHEELENQDISYAQEIRYNAEAGCDYIWTTLTIAGETKQPICGCRVITGALKGGNPAQEQGSAITYARRYSLLMALGWATEDDDAQSLGRNNEKKNNNTPKVDGGENRLDFNEIRKMVDSCEDMNALRKIKIDVNMKYRLSEAQIKVLKGIFDEKEKKING